MFNVSAISLIIFGMAIAGNMFILYALFKTTHAQKMEPIRAWVACMCLVWFNIMLGFVVAALSKPAV